MQKGQLFSLDFLISLVAVMAAIGLMIHTTELNTYQQKEERRFNELRLVAEQAGDMLVSNPEIICILVEDNEKPGGGNFENFGSLQNCLSKIDAAKIPKGYWDPEIQRPIKTDCQGMGAGCWWENQGNNRYGKILERRKLGIPKDFKCSIEIDGGRFVDKEIVIIRDCWDNPAGVESYYSVSRDVVIYTEENDSAVWKSHLDECVQGSPDCKLVPATVTIKVWRA